jgi:hypothetical protein
MMPNMTYSLVRKNNRSNLMESSRTVTVSQTRPLLDVQVGAALWKDRRVSASTKFWSLTAGLLMMACMLATDWLLARWIFGVHAVDPFSANTIALACGSLLFSTIALLRFAPAGVVNVVRLRCAGVIPLRVRKH